MDETAPQWSWTRFGELHGTLQTVHPPCDTPNTATSHRRKHRNNHPNHLQTTDHVLACSARRTLHLPEATTSHADAAHELDDWLLVLPCMRSAWSRFTHPEAPCTASTHDTIEVSAWSDAEDPPQPCIAPLACLYRRRLAGNPRAPSPLRQLHLHERTQDACEDGTGPVTVVVTLAARMQDNSVLLLSLRLTRRHGAWDCASVRDAACQRIPLPPAPDPLQAWRCEALGVPCVGPLSARAREETILPILYVRTTVQLDEDQAAAGAAEVDHWLGLYGTDTRHYTHLLQLPCLVDASTTFLSFFDDTASGGTWMVLVDRMGSRRPYVWRVSTAEVGGGVQGEARVGEVVGSAALELVTLFPSRTGATVPHTPGPCDAVWMVVTDAHRVVWLYRFHAKERAFLRQRKIDLNTLPVAHPTPAEMDTDAAMDTDIPPHVTAIVPIPHTRGTDGFLVWLGSGRMGFYCLATMQFQPLVRRPDPATDATTAQYVDRLMAAPVRCVEAWPHRQGQAGMQAGTVQWRVVLCLAFRPTRFACLLTCHRPAPTPAAPDVTQGTDAPARFQAYVREAVQRAGLTPRGKGAVGWTARLLADSEQRLTAALASLLPPSARGMPMTVEQAHHAFDDTADARRVGKAMRQAGVSAALLASMRQLSRETRHAHDADGPTAAPTVLHEAVLDDRLRVEGSRTRGSTLGVLQAASPLRPRTRVVKTPVSAPAACRRGPVRSSGYGGGGKGLAATRKPFLMPGEARRAPVKPAPRASRLHLPPIPQDDAGAPGVHVNPRGTPLVHLDQAPGQRVHVVRVSSCARHIITGADDGTCRFARVAPGHPVKVYRGHGGPVCDVAMSMDHRYVLTASTDAHVRLWSTATSAGTSTPAAHGDCLYTFNPSTYTNPNHTGACRRTRDTMEAGQASCRFFWHDRFALVALDSACLLYRLNWPTTPHGANARRASAPALVPSKAALWRIPGDSRVTTRFETVGGETPLFLVGTTTGTMTNPSSFTANEPAVNSWYTRSSVWSTGRQTKGIVWFRDMNYEKTVGAIGLPHPPTVTALPNESSATSDACQVALVGTLDGKGEVSLFDLRTLRRVQQVKASRIDDAYTSLANPTSPYAASSRALAFLGTGPYLAHGSGDGKGAMVCLYDIRKSCGNIGDSVHTFHPPPRRGPGEMTGASSMPIRATCVTSLAVARHASTWILTTACDNGQVDQFSCT